MVLWKQIDKDAPFAVAFHSIGMAWASKVVSAGALAGIVTSLLVNLFGQIRLWMTLGRERLVPEWIVRSSLLLVKYLFRGSGARHLLCTPCFTFSCNFANCSPRPRVSVINKTVTSLCLPGSFTELCLVSCSTWFIDFPTEVDWAAGTCELADSYAHHQQQSSVLS
jgi:hypothetical protein